MKSNYITESVIKHLKETNSEGNPNIYDDLKSILVAVGGLGYYNPVMGKHFKSSDGKYIEVVGFLYKSYTDKVNKLRWEEIADEIEYNTGEKQKKWSKSGGEDMNLYDFNFSVFVFESGEISFHFHNGYDNVTYTSGSGLHNNSIYNPKDSKDMNILKKLINKNVYSDHVSAINFTKLKKFLSEIERRVK